jgi:hypothetical protein
MDDSPSDEIDLTRTLRDLKSYLEGLEPSDLTPPDRAALRALFDDLDALRDMGVARRQGQILPTRTPCAWHTGTLRRAGTWRRKSSI